MSANSTKVYQTNGVSYTGNRGDTNYIQNDPFRSLTSPNLRYTFPTSNAILLQPRVVNFQPNTLGNTTHIYTSPVYDDIISLAAYFGDWSCAYKITEGPVHTIQVEIPWDTIANEDFWISDFASEQWELVPNQDMKSLMYSGLLANSFVSPSVPGNLVILPDTYKAGVQKQFENKYAYFAAPTGSSVPSASMIPYAQQTLNYLRFGVEGVPSYTQTLRRTAVIDERNSNNAFQTAIDAQLAGFRKTTGTTNFVMSTPGLQRYYSIPADTVAKFMLPSYSKLISIQAYDATAYHVYAGWLIKPPTFQFITRNKIQITQEFIWNEWLQSLYYIISPMSDFGNVSSAAANPNTPSGF